LSFSPNVISLTIKPELRISIPEGEPIELSFQRKVFEIEIKAEPKKNKMQIMMEQKLK
jgi:hypothetical protein